jgi:NAD(P)H dehydrogenase (quinone)
MANVLVLFYTTYGHNFTMAKAAVEGVSQAGSNAVLKRIPETLPDEVLAKMGALEAAKQWADVPVVTVDELPQYDAIVWAVPTRFGSIPAQVKTFLDATGGLWFTDALVGKVGSVMVSSNTQHGGQETTIHAMHTVLLHHGMVIVGLPYSFKGQSGVEEVKGGSPYGATTIAGSTGERQPSKDELDGAKFQGKHVATIANKLRA